MGRKSALNSLLIALFDFALLDEDMRAIEQLARADGRIADQDPARYEEF